MFIKKWVIALLSLCGIIALIFAHDISQKNPETIFLTENSLKEYKIFQKDIVEKHALLIKKEGRDKEAFYNHLSEFEKICSDDCEIITQKKLQKKENVFSRNDKKELIKLESEDFQAAIVLANTDEFHKKVLTAAENSNFWKENTSFAGIPYTNFLLDKYSLVIQEKLFPTMFIMGLVITFVFIGHLKNSLVVYLPCLFSAGFSLATLKLIDGQMNMVTSIVPLVVFTVSLSLSFHIYFSLIELKTLKAVFKLKWAPIFLMMFTTYIGFLSLGWAKISVIREFGFLSSQLVLFVTLYIFLWYFCWETMLERPVRKKNETFFPSWVFSKTLPHWIIVLITIVGVASVVLVPSRLKVMTDATYYFPKDQKIREKMIAITETVSGMPLMEIAVDLGHDFTIEDSKKLEQVEEEINKTKFEGNEKVISNNSLVKKANTEYSGNNILPDNIGGYFLLRSQLPLALSESYPVEKIYRMTLVGNSLNVKEYMRDLEKVSSILKTHGLNFRVNGIYHNLMLSQNAMIDVLIESFLSSAFIIFIFSSFFLRSLKNTLIFIFVSLLPVALTFGLMYLFGFSINIATVMTFSISLGLVGDSSFHIIYAKKVRFKDFAEYNRGVLSPVVGSGLLLCLCFGMFTLNSFMPIYQFGSILGIIMLFGTLTDLYILPTLLYLTTDHQKAYEDLGKN